jgi:hypothetical protein
MILIFKEGDGYEKQSSQIVFCGFLSFDFSRIKSSKSSSFDKNRTGGY